MGTPVFNAAVTFTIDQGRVDEALGVSMGLESLDVHTNTGYF